MSDHICHCDDTRWVASVRIDGQLVESVIFDILDPGVETLVAETRERHLAMTSRPGVESWGVTVECPTCHGAVIIDGG